MFRDLNTIPWHDLTHAYGSAEEVPMWLRQLASHEEQIRKQAIWHLTGAICHQGWICPATAYAVPFLLELLQEPGVQGKADILELLADIAAAPPELDEESWRRNPSALQWDVPRYIPFKNAHLEIDNGLPVYRALLTPQDEVICMRATQILACITPQTQEQRASLLAAFEQETAPAVRANLVLALGSLFQAAPEAWTFFEALVSSEGENLLVFSAAIMLARLRKQEMSDAVVQFLARVFLERPETLEDYRALPCGGGAPWLVAGWALAHLGAARLQFLVPSLPALFERAGRWEKSWLADLVVSLFFAEATPVPHEPRARADLTEIQWTVLTLLADYKEIWNWVDFSERMKAYGLPDSYGALLTFLGRDVPRPAQKPGLASRRTGSAQHQHNLLDLFRETLAARYPEVKARMFQQSSAHTLITVNDELVFRVPRTPEEIEMMKREVAVLRALQGRVPLPISDPRYVSEETDEIGRAFMGYPKLPGKPLSKEMLESVASEEISQELVAQIVSFLSALHHFPLDELAPAALPLRHSREQYVALYARVREVLFPPMPAEAREQTIASFETFLDTAEHFSLAPVLVHGNFGPACILYHARDHAVSGILDFSQAGLGDPASDFGRLLGPHGYGLEALQRCEQAYPELARLYDRMHFYAQATFLQDTLASIERQRRQEAQGFAGRQTSFPR